MALLASSLYIPIRKQCKYLTDETLLIDWVEGLVHHFRA